MFMLVITNLRNTYDLLLIVCVNYMLCQHVIEVWITYYLFIQNSFYLFFIQNTFKVDLIYLRSARSLLLSGPSIFEWNLQFYSKSPHSPKITQLI